MQHNLRPRKTPPDSVKTEHVAVKKKSSAQKQKEYRARLKDGHSTYKLYRSVETERVKQYRRTCSEEQKARNREMGMERMRRYREKKKTG